MRKVIYLYLVFAMALPAIMTPILWWTMKFSPPTGDAYISNLIMLFSLTGNTIPSLLFALMPPSILREGAVAVIVALVVRRLWLYAKTRSLDPPLSFRGVLLFLGIVAFAFFTLAWIGGSVTALYVYATGARGVPVGVSAIALVPTSFALPTAFFVTELFSFRRAKFRHPQA